MDKTIEIMKAAMEKEKMQNNKEDKDEKEQQPDTCEKNEDQVNEADTSAASGEKAEACENNNDDEAEDIAVEQDEKQGKAKGFFKGSKSKELAAKDAMIAELSDKLMRNMAEFDNYRKRTDKEKSAMYDLGVKSLLEKILPVVDNFERGLSSVTDEDKGSAFVQGIELIYRQLMSTLEEIGLKPIDAVGKEFDPSLHNAVMHGEDENLGPNTVSEEFQKGYTYRDMVVRYSMVKVVN